MAITGRFLPLLSPLIGLPLEKNVLCILGRLSLTDFSRLRHDVFVALYGACQATALDLVFRVETNRETRLLGVYSCEKLVALVVLVQLLLGRRCVEDLVGGFSIH